MLYFCDPLKNKDCEKQSCAYNEFNIISECLLTSDAKYAMDQKCVSKEVLDGIIIGWELAKDMFSRYQNQSITKDEFEEYYDIVIPHIHSWLEEAYKQIDPVKLYFKEVEQNGSK